MVAPTFADTQAKFSADPSAARGTPTVTATLVDGRAHLSAGAFTWEADLPTVIGGTNAAPSPTAYLLGALAGCGVAFLADTLAPQYGVRVDAITAVARCATDLRGLIGMDGASPELDDLALDIEVTTSDPGDRVEAMFAAWRERCPIFLALLRPRNVALSTKVA